MNLSNVKIYTNRLLLKPISMQYKAEIFSEFTEEITTYMHPRSPKDISEIEAFIQLSLDNLKAGSNIEFINWVIGKKLEKIPNYQI